jgi:hypothetical protein
MNACLLCTSNEKCVGHVRRSAVDVIRIASELLHAFAELHIPVPAELVAQCTDGVDAVLQGWVVSSGPFVLRNSVVDTLS